MLKIVFVQMISEKRSLDENPEELVEVLANIMEENRCTFFEFSAEKMEIVAEVVNFLMNTGDSSCFIQKAGKCYIPIKLLNNKIFRTLNVKNILLLKSMYS